MNLQDLIRAARKLGRKHGEAAGSWVTDGNTEPETYVKLRQGILDGDPEIMDSLPSCPLSGEYADSMTPWKLWEELGVTEAQLRSWESGGELDLLCHEYETAYSEAVERTVLHACQHALEG